MKNIFVGAVLAVAAMGLTACSSDDDNNVSQDPMVGDWKAYELSYSFVNPATGELMTNTHPFSHEMISEGCDVDELDLKANNIADLEIESKIDGTCVESHIAGTWNATTITILGETSAREVISVSATELVLKYPMTFTQFGTTDVTVKFSKS